ncbi:MAG: hypothetical protein AAFZ58_13195 [Pseudomonadota bacterium]
MSENIYAPPESDVDFEAAASDGVQFYVVSVRKFLLLAIMTMNLYVVYWFWRNWRDVRDSTGDDLWPIPRAIFYIFFTHSLFGLVDDKVKEKDASFTWSHRSIATLVVVLTVISSVASNAVGPETGGFWVSLVSIAMAPIVAVLLSKAQAVINMASGDPTGSSNSSLTVANWLWMVIGLLFWLLSLFGLYAIFITS